MLWYAAYGSNLDAERFRCYLHGGCPPGATRSYPGAREPGDPLDERPFRMSGRLAFAWHSPTWDGGIAFHVPGEEGEVLARAYLLADRQFHDVVEQENWREPGADHDLAGVLRDGSAALGPGRYETLHLVGELDGHPVLTFSCPDVDLLGLNPPAAAYVETMARGLRDSHRLDDDQVSAYLSSCRGFTA